MKKNIWVKCEFVLAFLMSLCLTGGIYVVAYAKANGALPGVAVIQNEIWNNMDLSGIIFAIVVLLASLLLLAIVFLKEYLKLRKRFKDL